jgi:hypothetical protein
VAKRMHINIRSDPVPDGLSGRWYVYQLDNVGSVAHLTGLHIAESKLNLKTNLFRS